MADPVKAEGLVIAYTVGSTIYPLACAKDATLSIASDMLELAPKPITHIGNSYQQRERSLFRGQVL